MLEVKSLQNWSIVAVNFTTFFVDWYNLYQFLGFQGIP